MSSTNSIPVTQVAAGSTGVANHKALGGSPTSGALASGMGGMANFWDMIISQFGLGVDDTETGVSPQAPSVQTNTDILNTTKNPQGQQPGKDNPLALLQIALSSQTLDDNGNIVLDTESVSAAKIERQLGLTNTIINHLKNVLPENPEKDGIMSGVLAKLQAKSDTLQASLSAIEGSVIAKDTPVEDLPLPVLIALGLNPAEITEVSEKIKDLQEKLGRDITVEDLIAGVGGILPPTPQQAVASLKATTDSKTVVIDSIDDNSQPTDDLAAQLNALDVGAGDASGDAEKDPQAGITNIQKDEFGLKKPEGLPVNDGQPLDGKSLKPELINGQVKKDTAGKDYLVNLLNTGKTLQNDLSFPVTYSAAQSDTALFQPYGIAATSSVSLGTGAQAASMISSPTVAGQNHPATQLVAATLVKAGKGGEDSTINLRLDPPELGNVAVRLQFSKDKTVKAIVTAEKPETYMMLSRESNALERALQSAGYDTQNQTISFELAQDNGAFRRDDNANGGGNNFGKGNGGASQDAGHVDDFVQSSMTWHVDPSTGRMRYNIMA